MILGFTGTRGHVSRTEPIWRMPAGQAFALENLIRGCAPDEVHHGDCLGADAEFHDLILRGIAGCCRVVIHPPLDDKHRAFCSTMDLRVSTVYPERFLDRNHDIVNASERLVACPAGTEHLRSGTWATVRYARKRGRPVTLIYPDGRVVHEEAA